MTTIRVTCTNNRTNTNNETETTHTCTEEGTWIPQIHACQGKCMYTVHCTTVNSL